MPKNGFRLTCDAALLSFPFPVAPSSNGRTADSGSARRGSNPWGATKLRNAIVRQRLKSLGGLDFNWISQTSASQINRRRRERPDDGFSAAGGVNPPTTPRHKLEPPVSRDSFLYFSSHPPYADRTEALWHTSPVKNSNRRARRGKIGGRLVFEPGATGAKTRREPMVTK